MVQAAIKLGQRCRPDCVAGTVQSFNLRPTTILTPLNTAFRRGHLLSNAYLSNHNALMNTRQQHRSAILVPCRAAFTAADIAADVGVLVEGEPKMRQVFSNSLSDAEVDTLTAALYEDSKLVVKQAAMVLIEGEDRESPPGPLELSLVLCDDPHIQELNKEWRGKDAPTDVLSFEMGGGYDDELEGEEVEIDAEFEDIDENEEDEGETCVSDEEDDWDDGSGPSVTLLGDVVISLDTAARQAAERGYSLHDECRILLVHGVLHLLGYDHENGGEEEVEMAEAETKILKALGWKGQGLVAAATQHDTSAPLGKSSPPPLPSPKRTSEVRLLALDMDGTLLDSNSRVLPSSVSAIKAALRAGVKVILATGKARPAAITAMQKVGLAGDGLVVGTKQPGLFLQGLAVYGMDGTLIGGGNLPREVVRLAFDYAVNTETPICGFLGDECVTINRMTPEIELLHTRYYEPLAEVAPSVDHVVEGCPPMKKLLFMTSAEQVANRIKPQWDSWLSSDKHSGAQTMQAVPDMLEIVPKGWNKFVGLQVLLELEGKENFPLESIMAIGDGGNDLELVAGVGIGVAMGNAVDSVKDAAVAVVANNDDGGIAEAIEKFIL